MLKQGARNVHIVLPQLENKSYGSHYSVSPAHVLAKNLDLGIPNTYLTSFVSFSVFERAVALTAAL